jgi:copper(I)-binding protein
MKKPLIATILAALVVMASHAGWAGQAGSGGLRFEQAWARASIGAAKAGAAYLTIVNHGETVDRLVGAATPVAKHAGLHTHLLEEGVMKMRPLEAVEVAPGAPAVFKPGGLHVMLMGLRRPLKEGETFPLVLTFQKAGEIEIQIKVLAATSMGYDPHMEHHEGHHQEHHEEHHGDAPKTN